MNDSCHHFMCWTQLQGQQHRERLIPIYRGSIEAQTGEEIASGHMVSQKNGVGILIQIVLCALFPLGKLTVRHKHTGKGQEREL